jgi:hypothetical protein
MLGSTTFLAIVLLSAAPENAGMASISDGPDELATTVAADADRIEPVAYVAAPDPSDKKTSGNISLLQAMIEEQAPKKAKHRASPFQEEADKPGEALAEPPRRLPSDSKNEAANKLPEARNDNAWAGYGSCGVPSCESDGCAPQETPSTATGPGRSKKRSLFGGICYEGWIDQGFTINPYSPRDRSNYPVGFNNRSNDYQLNQAYLRFKRDVNREGDRWDVGGTLDLLYGTDSFYASSRGLEVDRDFGPKWNAQQYGLAMPQCYMEVFAPWGEDGASMKLGHFYTILGYETTPAPENFFYSHSFNLIYGEPVTETGVLAEKKFGNYKIQAGFSRGWDNWEDNNNDLSFLGGFSWTSDSKRTSLAFAIQDGREQAEPPTNSNNRTVFSIVFQQKIGQRYDYVLQYDYGQEERTDVLGLPTAKWTGLGNYLFYTINEHWKAGMRVEWFRDEDGFRCPHGSLLGADYYELTAGLNWIPNSRVTVRPEVRYDWVGTPNVTPYVDASKSYQFIIDCDVIIKF